MLRIRKAAETAAPRRRLVAEPALPAQALAAGASAGRPRLAACGMLGLVLGAGLVMLTAPLVQAGDDADVRLFQAQEAVRRSGRSAGSSAYAPATGAANWPLAGATADGRIAHPAPRGPARATNPTGTVSGASDSGRSLCVRLCDGYHMPIGNLRAQADFAAHEALCSALNPGIPVKLFRVAPGATTIDDAVARDGKTYSALPVAYGHEKSGDPACRPAIATAADRRVSLLRDFTLRAGDTVVLDGRAATFRGASSWPYSRRDFADFRTAPELADRERQSIDQLVGISYREAQMRALRRSVRVRDARVQPEAGHAGLRGRLDDSGASLQPRRIPAAPRP